MCSQLSAGCVDDNINNDIKPLPPPLPPPRPPKPPPLPPLPPPPPLPNPPPLPPPPRKPPMNITTILSSCRIPFHCTEEN